jgi:hypothetical protein
MNVSSAVNDVLTAAVAFYRLPGSDAQARTLAATIRVKSGALFDQLLILKQAGLDIDTDELLKRFRQAVTGGEFDSQLRAPLNDNSPEFELMSGAAHTLTSTVQTAMLRKLLAGVK